MSGFVFTSRGEDDTARLGAVLAECLPVPAVVALCGTLGAGKTRLVQAVAQAAGVDRQRVVSPTFVLVQQYEGRVPIFHVDAYRLRDEDEFLQLGPEEFFEAPAWTFLEWADRVAACLPRQRVEIRIEVTGDTSREFHVTATGDRYAPLVERLARVIDKGW